MFAGEVIAITVLVALGFLAWQFGRYLRAEQALSVCGGTGAAAGRVRKRSSATVHCLQCRRPLRIGLPPRSNVGRCPECGHRFTIILWDSGNNLYISPADDEFEGPVAQSGAGGRGQLGVFLETLGLDPGTSPDDLSLREVRKAYYKTIQKYHPDKYSQLPAEFRRIAERKTRELHQAYRGLIDFKRMHERPSP